MSSRSMRFGVLTAVAAMLALAPAGAQAATLALPTGPCAFSTQTGANFLTIHRTVPFGVAGLTPGAFFTVAANGSAVGDGTANAAGAAVSTFDAPFLDDAEKLFTIQVSDQTNVATANIMFSSHSLNVKPSSGKPNRKVKIHLYGWLGKRVYLHFIPPHKKKAARTVKLGKSKGVCGHNTVRLRHFYSSARPKAGKWTLAFDTHKKYTKSDPLSIIYTSTISYL